MMEQQPGTQSEIGNGGAILGSGGGAFSRRRPVVVWGRSLQPTEAGGSRDKAPTRLRHGGLGAEPPALEYFAFFGKNNLILGLL